MAQQGSILGNSVQRKEDPGLLTGANRYYDDLQLDGLAHLSFVRSTMAHAELTGVDVADARSMPGVLGAFTADDLDLPDFLSFPMLPELFARPVLAKGRVRFVGDIVAVVVAESAAAAADAAEQVVVDLEPLDVVVDLEEAATDATVVWPEHGSNVAFETELGEPDPTAGADVVVEQRIVSQRLAGVPMEPNGCVAEPGEPDGGVTLWASSQNPIDVRNAIAPQLGLEPGQVRVAAPWVGGGFGPKAGLYAEYILTCAVAREVGRPVKWTETRSENMVAMVHGRAMVMWPKLGLSSDGTIVGLEVEVLADAGAYPGIGAFLIMMTQTMSQGVYRIPAIRFHGRGVVTNTTQTAAYRGAGRPEATQMLERILDIAADEIGMDPAELRRKNLLRSEEFPLTTVTGANYDSGDYVRPLDAVLEAADYTRLREEQEQRRSSGDAKQLGIGISTYVEITAPLGLHVEWGSVSVDDDGTVVARVGTSSHGQGHHTAFAMLLSDLMGVSMDDVRLVESDTDEIPRGSGTMGSRSLQTAGSALHVAGTAVMDKARKLAAHLLEADPDDIVVADSGGLGVAGVPASSLSWAELAQAANDDSRRPEGMEAGLSEETDFDGTDSTFPFGAHVAVVEVDTETGNVELVRHVAVDDCGRILNPLIVAGQQHGGIGQGVAQALYEWVRYDEDGNPVSATLMDYLMPSAAEFPSFEVSNTETPSPRNPLGAKGIGESGTIGSTPAVHNAVVDAVSHLGVRHIDMPASPERMWQALEGARQPA